MTTHFVAHQQKPTNQQQNLDQHQIPKMKKTPLSAKLPTTMLIVRSTIVVALFTTTTTTTIIINCTTITVRSIFTTLLLHLENYLLQVVANQLVHWFIPLLIYP